MIGARKVKMMLNPFTIFNGHLALWYTKFMRYTCARKTKKILENEISFLYFATYYYLSFKQFPTLNFVNDGSYAAV